MDPIRLERLTQLKQLIESGSEDWNTLTMLESYFFGEVSGCRCKTSNVRSKLNRYWELNKQELNG